ncbi:hypothetical protein BDR04DRAFT_1159494 [Suillus decipiens]|nr:hypothetical protein BDR04DRAFT_1159494 [Suillus decipiens]
MFAGGGASVVHSAAIAAAGVAHELASNSKYSGVPSEGQTFEYARTILDLLTHPPPRPDGKVLIIWWYCKLHQRHCNLQRSFSALMS